MRGASADTDTQSEIITLIKILRIKRSLIKDPVKLWRCQVSGLALLFCRWWVAKQNQRSLNYQDESQSQKGMRGCALWWRRTSTSQQQTGLSPARREPHASKLSAVNIPDKWKDWINSYANVSEVVAHTNPSRDLVIDVNFLSKIWINIRKTPIPVLVLLGKHDPTWI